MKVDGGGGGVGNPGKKGKGGVWGGVCGFLRGVTKVSLSGRLFP